MNRIKASIAIIGFQKEGPGMYPHLFDFLHNMRESFEEVIYIDDDDRGEHLYLVEYYIRTALSCLGLRGVAANIKLDSIQSGTSENKKLSVVFIVYLLKKIFMYVVRQFRLIIKIRTIKFRHDKKIIIAIDHTAKYFAFKLTKGCPIIFWSFDVLAEDAPWRIKNGLLEKIITSGSVKFDDVLMIQDSNRKKLLEKSVGKFFNKTIYLPVGLNDSEYCQFAAEKRANRDCIDVVKIIQCGLLSEIRLSAVLIDEYQKWPSSFELFLHGKICGKAVEQKLRNVTKIPVISSKLYDNDMLSKFLDSFDIGFVGYGETDSNFIFVENASTQLIGFLRLGIPVIVCGSEKLNDFIEENQVGVAVGSIKDMEEKIRVLIDNYAFYSSRARQLYLDRFNLNTIFASNLIPSITEII